MTVMTVMTKEETLCVELPGLVKAWNLERLQMECETEAPWPRDWLMVDLR